jgi:peptidoglycan/LPS O-acetylase OafA/YrhL
VAYHAGVPAVPGGFIGVDVFFVISGFLISRLLLDDATRHGRIDLGDFYARRVRRILPALVLVVLVTMTAMPLVSFTSAQMEQASASAVAALFFYSNFYFWSQADSYFAPQLELLPLLHTWSLAIEEQFYMIWPLALAALVVVARRFKWNVATAATAFFAAVLFTSLAFSVWSTSNQPLAAFYLMPARAWELATGGLLVVFTGRLQAVPLQVRQVMRLAGVAGIISSALTFSATTAFPGVAALLPVLSTALVIASFEGATPADPRSWLAARPMVFVGLLSYSWYLWHWPLLALRRLYYLGERALLPDLLVCAVAFVLAYLSYRFVETPVRTMHFGFLRRKRWTFAFGAGLCLVGFASAQLAVIAAAPNVSTRLAAAAADKPPLQTWCNPSGRFQGFPSDAVCSDGAVGAPIGVVLWGDSHASHLMPMVGEALRPLQLAALQRTRSGCPPLVNATTAAQGRVDLECVKFNTAVMAELAERRAAGLRGVIINARWALYLNVAAPNPRETFVRALTRIDAKTLDQKPNLGVWPHDSKGSAETLRQSLRETVEAVNALGLSAMIVAPTPEMAYPVPDCLARRHEQACGSSRRVVDDRRAPAMAAIGAAADGLDHVKVWDPIDRLCDAEHCFVARDGLVLYTDEDHFTASWSRRLAEYSGPIVEWLVKPVPRETQPQGPFARLSVREIR